MSVEDEQKREEELEAIRKQAAEEAISKAQEEFEKAEKARVEELQAERQRRQAAEEELERSKKGANSDDDTDPEKVFTRLLSQKEQKEAEENKKKALEQFRRKVKEFDPEVDKLGIVFKDFEKELSKFNLEGLKTIDDFTSRFSDVYDFMNRKNPGQKPSQSFYQGNSKGSGSEPLENDTSLDDREQRLIKDMGWTKERYLEQKSRRPHYVESLLRYRS